MENSLTVDASLWGADIFYNVTNKSKECTFTCVYLRELGSPLCTVSLYCQLDLNSVIFFGNISPSYIFIYQYVFSYPNCLAFSTMTGTNIVCVRTMKCLILLAQFHEAGIVKNDPNKSFLATVS